MLNLSDLHLFTEQQKAEIIATLLPGFTFIGLQAFAGEPTNAVAASASVGYDPPTDGVVVTAPVDPSWENFGVEVIQLSGANQDVYAEVGGGSLNIYLGTDENGDPDDSKNSPELIAAAVEAVPGWSATYAGLTPPSPELVFLSGYIAGTPGYLGRLAIFEGSVWVAMKDDNSPSQDGWVRIYEPLT